MTRPAEISIVVLFDVPSEPNPYRIGLATAESLVLIRAEADELALAVRIATALSREMGLPIVTRLRRGTVH